jgi:hypothetical protein
VCHDIAGKGLDSSQYAVQYIDAIEKDADAREASLAETAKWLVSGIAVATAGVIAATSLSSLGSMALDARLAAALLAAVLGYSGLGYLFATALAVIVPQNHSLREIANGTGLPAAWKSEIQKKLTPIIRDKFKTLTEFCDYAEGPAVATIEGTELLGFNLTTRRLRAVAKLTEHDLQFRRLKCWMFLVTPAIAIAFLVFAWAANPPKEQDVPTMEKMVNVNAADLPLLGKITAAACSGSTLHVIVLGEWPSGVQDVVTVPSQGCPPVRLRLDNGRLSAAK